MGSTCRVEWKTSLGASEERAERAVAIKRIRALPLNKMGSPEEFSGKG